MTVLPQVTVDILQIALGNDGHVLNTGSPESVQVLYSAQWDSVSVLYVYNNTKVGN